MSYVWSNLHSRGHARALTACSLHDACWQREQSTVFEAVFLCGNVGVFTSDNQLDKATRRLGKTNPCELEFLYTIKERVVETPATAPFAAESFAWIEPEQEAMGFSLSEESTTGFFVTPVPFASESRFSFTENYLADLTEIMRQRQMLDLDQLRVADQKPDSVTFTDLVWADEELFESDWIGLSDQPEKSDFWNEVFEHDLPVVVKSDI